MKILHVINNLGSGGAEKLILEFAPIIKERGHCIEVLLLKTEGSIYLDDLRKAGIKVSCLSSKSLYSFLFIFCLRRFFRDNNFDIIHVHLFPSLYWVSFASILTLKKLNLVFTEHSTSNRRMQLKIFRLLDIFVYRSYDKVIGITDQVTNNIIKYTNGDLLKYITIENGIDISKFTHQAFPLQLPFVFDDSDCIITMIGRFSDAKDQNTIIRALRFLPDSIKLLLVGEGPLMAQSDLLAHSLGVHNQVYFLGVRRDISAILNITTIAVQSSHWEGFGLAAVESMAAGKPTIASNVEGLSSVVKDAGLLFEHENAEDLANQINILLSDRDYYAKVAAACKQRAEKYSIEKMVDNYLDLYNHLLY